MCRGKGVRVVRVDRLAGLLTGAGLGHESVELGGADLGGVRRDLSVDPTHRVGCQSRGRVDGGLGDEPGSPGGNTAGLDGRPQPWETVPQLQCVADEAFGRGGGDAQDGAELRDAELRHARAARAGDGFLVFDPRQRVARRGVHRLRRVEVCPQRRSLELACRGCVLGALLRTGKVQHLTSRHRVGRIGHGSGLGLGAGHVFDPRGDHRHLDWQGGRGRPGPPTGTRCDL